MKALGSLGGMRGKGNAQLKRALKTALEGSSESARVAASRVLLDALAEPQPDRQQAADVAGARERLAFLIAAGGAAAVGRAGRARQVAAAGGGARGAARGVPRAVVKNRRGGMGRGCGMGPNCLGAGARFLVVVCGGD
jgi:hypothetical protein